MAKNNIDFKLTHVIGFTYGAIISYMLTQFIKSINDDITKPVLSKGIENKIGKNKKIKICNTEIQLNGVIVSFIQLVIVISLVSIMIDLGVKPQGKLF